MSRKKWVSAVSKGDQQVTLPAESTTTSNEDVVLLLGGFNNFGDKIYNYLKLPLDKVEELINALKNGGRFDIRDFGEVIAAGLGTPTPDVRQEIESVYKMMTMPASS